MDAQLLRQTNTANGLATENNKARVSRCIWAVTSRETEESTTP